MTSDVTESLEERFNSIPSDSPEKQFHSVSLTRDRVSGLGLKLAGGRSGLFIASITPGGPAEQDGSIRIGDRLVAINGKNAEGKFSACEDLFRDEHSGCLKLQLIHCKNNANKMVSKGFS